MDYCFSHLTPDLLPNSYLITICPFTHWPITSSFERVLLNTRISEWIRLYRTYLFSNMICFKTFIITIFRNHEYSAYILRNSSEHPTNKLKFRVGEWFMQQVSPSFLETSMFYDNNLLSSFGGFIPIGNFSEDDRNKRTVLEICM